MSPVLPMVKNGKSAKQLITVIYMVAITGFVAVKDVAAPLVKSISNNRPDITNQVLLNTKRLDIIETFNLNIGSKVDALLVGSATRSEAIDNIKIQIDRIEKKLDEHMK